VDHQKSKWLDHICSDNSFLPADLWRSFWGDAVVQADDAVMPMNESGCWCWCMQPVESLMMEDMKLRQDTTILINALGLNNTLTDLDIR